MNILFFLTPKSEVAYIEDSFSLRQILEKMEIHRYSAIPILSNNGEYVGTITEGDILWYCKKNSMSALKTAETIFLSDIPKKFEYASVSINSNMEDLIARAMAQNFVPVVDDQNKFIGIVTRKDIIGYCYKKTENHAVRLIIFDHRSRHSSRNSRYTTAKPEAFTYKVFRFYYYIIAYTIWFYNLPVLFTALTSACTEASMISSFIPAPHTTLPFSISIPT